jgi:plasmid stabilization system protein ParE
MVWYRDRSPGLDQEFYLSFLEVVSTIAQSPMMYRSVYGEVRRVIFRKFPYALFYVFHETTPEPSVVILSCLHERRSPDRWPKR